MAHNSLNLNFNLRKPNATSPTPINLVIRYNNEKFTYPAGEHILPKNWQGEKTKKGYQRAKANAFNDYRPIPNRIATMNISYPGWLFRAEFFIYKCTTAAVKLLLSPLIGTAIDS